jgi:CheY-like chemotaxis protein
MAAQRVLVVDDDPAVGEVIVSILEGAGYETTLARDAPSAIAAARKQDFELMISDLVLGGAGDGHDSVDPVQAIQPDLKVIFVSGYGTSPYGSARDDPVIAKPFNSDDLLARVKELIGAAASG